MSVEARQCTSKFCLASFPGPPSYGGGEPGTFYHMHHVDTT